MLRVDTRRIFFKIDHNVVAVLLFHYSNYWFACGSRSSDSHFLFRAEDLFVCSHPCSCVAGFVASLNELITPLCCSPPFARPRPLRSLDISENLGLWASLPAQVCKLIGCLFLL